MLLLNENNLVPANAINVNAFLHGLANFDWIPFELMDKMEGETYSYLPEEEPYSINFSTGGYESRLFIGNIGLPIWLIYFNIILTILYLLFCYCCKRYPQLAAKLKQHIHYNGQIRFFIELYFDVILFSALNLKTADWGSPNALVIFSNILAVIFMALNFVLPMTLLVYYY